MSIKQFTEKQNIQMLWDVVSDEDIFTFLTPDIQSKIYNLFLNNIQGFFELERTKTNSLVDLNKKYILLILNHIKKTYPYQPSKIKIYNEPIAKQLITYEEIQNDKKTQFDKDFIKRQEEFENSMTIKVPQVPDFTDKESDKPIKEMDKIVKEMLAQRNYEVEQINRTYNTSNKVDNWLKPQETSLKKLNQEIKEQSINDNKFKYLNQFNEVSSQTNTKKNVSFSNNDEIKTFSIETNINEDEEDISIFSKLKKINKQDDNINLELHEPIIKENNFNEDRIAKLERNVNNLNEKMDKIINLLTNKSN